MRKIEGARLCKLETSRAFMTKLARLTTYCTSQHCLQHVYQSQSIYIFLKLHFFCSHDPNSQSIYIPLELMALAKLLIYQNVLLPHDIFC